MSALQCDVCGGRLIMDDSREFSTCEGCGTQYTVGAMRNMMQGLEDEELKAGLEGRDQQAGEQQEETQLTEAERLTEEQRIESERQAALKKAEDILNGDEGAAFDGGDAKQGAVKWQALAFDKENNRVLAITRECVAKMPYHKLGGRITWEGCTLRRWLNADFYNSLPQEVKVRVAKLVNQNPNNQQRGTSGGNPTNDKVFLLSSEEAQRYFKCDSERIAEFQGSKIWWWLRSPGDFADYAANIFIVGSVYTNGNIVHYDMGGVRPAIWLNL